MKFKKTYGDPIMVPLYTPEQRGQIYERILFEVHGFTMDDWSPERRSLESLRLNDPHLHAAGIHAELILRDGEQHLRLRQILTVDYLRSILLETEGREFSDTEIVSNLRAGFPSTDVMDLAIDGLPHLCLVGTWATLGFERRVPAPAEPSATAPGR